MHQPTTIRRRRISKILHWKYEKTLLDDDLIECNSGVCQGCPLSPAIFQLVMSDLLRPIREQFPFPITSFQDDVKAIGSVSKLLRIFD